MGRVIIYLLDEYDALTDNPTFFCCNVLLSSRNSSGKALLTQLTPCGQSEMLRSIFFFTFWCEKIWIDFTKSCPQPCKHLWDELLGVNGASSPHISVQTLVAEREHVPADLSPASWSCRKRPNSYMRVCYPCVHMLLSTQRVLALSVCLSSRHLFIDT